MRQKERVCKPFLEKLPGGACWPHAADFGPFWDHPEVGGGQNGAKKTGNRVFLPKRRQPACRALSKTPVHVFLAKTIEPIFLHNYAPKGEGLQTVLEKTAWGGMLATCRGHDWHWSSAYGRARLDNLRIDAELTTKPHPTLATPCQTHHW